MEGLLSFAFASLLHASSPHTLVDDPLRSTDWATAEVEATLLLSQYLRTNTVNPPGNEAEGVDFISKILAAEGIESTRVELEEGRESIYARLDGPENGETLCLLSHIDVVPAESDQWAHPPDLGMVTEGAVWGRGALDMKGAGALQLQVFRMLHRLDQPLKRNVVLIAVADEEVANGGVRQLIADHWSDLQCTHAINEGGIGLRGLIFENQDLYTISVGEKGVLWVRVTAKGVPGHGSTPRPSQSPSILLEALKKIESTPPQYAPPESFYTLTSIAGKARGGLIGGLLQYPFVVKRLLKRKVLANPISAAGTTNTINLTGFDGALSPNVVPSESSALLDIRVLPGTSTADMLDTLRERINDDRVHLEVLTAHEAEVSPIDDPVYRALARHSERTAPDAVAVPAISVGFTDSVFLRQKGVHAYGLVPFMVTGDELMGMHGNNEHVSLENIATGLRIYWGALLDLALKTETPQER